MDRPVAYRIMCDTRVVIVEFEYTKKTMCWYEGAHKLRDVLGQSWYFPTSQPIGQVRETLSEAVAVAAEYIEKQAAYWRDIAERLNAIAE